MGWTNDELNELLLPSDAVVPGDDAWFFGTNIPLELRSAGVRAALIAYLGTYDPALAPAATQTVYNYVAIYAPGSGYKGLQIGCVVEQGGVRRPINQIVNYYNDSTDSSSILLSAHGSPDPARSDVHFDGAVWNSVTNTELLRHANAAFPSVRGYGVWRACPLASGWTNSSPTIGVLMTTSGTVHMRGLIVPGTTADGTVVATLPADLTGDNSYRPSADLAWVGRSGNAAGLCGLTVTSSGNVVIRTTTGGAPSGFMWMTGSWVPF